MHPTPATVHETTDYYVTKLGDGEYKIFDKSTNRLSAMIYFPADDETAFGRAKAKCEQKQKEKIQ